MPAKKLNQHCRDPDIQYVINPGAGIVNPNNPTQKIKNEFVIGLRTNITS